MLPLIIVGVIAVVLVMWIIGMYNGLVGLRNAVKNAWSQIDVQLKRRHDLIPNLVESAKGYMNHERETLDVAPGTSDEFDDRVDQLGRQVVDDVPAEIFEHTRRTGAASAGHAGDEQDVGHERTVGRYTLRVRRYSSRGMVLAAAYSSALARNPGGGAGSSIRSSSRPLSDSVFT